jgi:hypothetical protein
MTIEASVVTALAAVAGGRVYPIVAPEKAVKPFVVYKPKTTPITLLSGSIIGNKTLIVFEAWGNSYSEAMTTAAAVQTAIIAASLHGVGVEPPEDGYDMQTDEYVRPLAFEFLS